MSYYDYYYDYEPGSVYGPATLIIYGHAHYENIDLIREVLEREIDNAYTGNGLILKIPSLQDHMAVRSFENYALEKNYVYNLNSPMRLQESLYNNSLTWAVLFTNPSHFSRHWDVREFTDFLKSKQIPITTYLIN